MQKKQYFHWLWEVLIILAMIPIAYASGFLQPIRSNDLGELSRGRYKLLSVIAGCELDNKCVQVTLKELIKKDNHPVYEQYLAELNQHRDEIEYEQMHCNTTATRAYRREITGCINMFLSKVDPAKGLTMEIKNSWEDKLNQCVQVRMKNMANSGNLYALQDLMEESLKEKDIPGFERWYSALQMQRTKLEFSTYRECIQPFRPFDWVPSEIRKR